MRQVTKKQTAEKTIEYIVNYGSDYTIVNYTDGSIQWSNNTIQDWLKEFEDYELSYYNNDTGEEHTIEYMVDNFEDFSWEDCYKDENGTIYEFKITPTI